MLRCLQQAVTCKSVFNQRLLKYSALFTISIFTSYGFADSVLVNTAVRPSLASTLLQVVGALVFIVLLIFLSAWCAKKFNLTGYHKHHDNLRAISSLNVGRKEKIMLVSVQNKKLLLGVTAGSINVLHNFEEEYQANDVQAEKRDVEEIKQSLSGPSTSGTRFADFIQNIMSNGRLNEK